MDSSVTTSSHGGSPSQIGGGVYGQVGEEEDYDYSEEIEEDLTQQTQGGRKKRRVRQVPEIGERVHNQRIRNRRQSQDNRAKELDRELNCGATQCTIIKCSAGPLTTNNNVVFKLRARIWAQTISEVRLQQLQFRMRIVKLKIWFAHAD